MQIISGKVRGKRLETLVTDNTRPTIGRIREAVFNIIANKVKGSVVLDLFAGTGAYGAECLSRGAGRVTFNDMDKEAARIINKNTNFAKERAQVYSLDYMGALDKIKLDIISRRRDKFTLVFLDPPYQSNFGLNAINYLVLKDMLATDALIVFETDKCGNWACEFPKSLTYRFRDYGRVRVYFLEAKTIC